jgi:hypothetical protein
MSSNTFHPRPFVKCAPLGHQFRRAVVFVVDITNAVPDSRDNLATEGVVGDFWVRILDVNRVNLHPAGPLTLGTDRKVLGSHLRELVNSSKQRAFADIVGTRLVVGTCNCKAYHHC